MNSALQGLREMYREINNSKQRLRKYIIIQEPITLSTRAGDK